MNNKEIENIFDENFENFFWDAVIRSQPSEEDEQKGEEVKRLNKLKSNQLK